MLILNIVVDITFKRSMSCICNPSFFLRSLIRFFITDHFITVGHALIFLRTEGPAVPQVHIETDDSNKTNNNNGIMFGIKIWILKGKGMKYMWTFQRQLSRHAKLHDRAGRSNSSTEILQSL